MEVLLSEFREIAKNRYEIPGQIKERTGKKILGYFCTYFPAELVHAAGILPVRILGAKRQVIHTETNLPSFGCSFLRTSFELAYEGVLDAFDGFVFSHTCDSMQAVADIWHNVFRNKFVTDILFPVHLTCRHTAAYLQKEFISFQCEIEKHWRLKVSEEGLLNSIRTYNRGRELLNELYNWRRIHPHTLKCSDILSIVISSAIILKEDHNRLLETFMQKLKRQNTDSDSIGSLPKVVLVGNICAFPDIIDIIERSKAIVVDDYLCTGARAFSGMHNLKCGEAALAQITAEYLKKIPCPSKYAGGQDTAETIVNLAQSNGADGVIFLLLKLCDPFSFDYTAYIKKLDQKGYPSLLIQYDMQTDSFSQIQTRIEAFIEILQGR